MSILRHGVAREVRTGLFLLTPEKHRRIFLFTLALLLLLAGPAWSQSDIWRGARPSRDPCAGATVGTQDCSLETRVKAVLGIAAPCDLPELLAASRAWAKLSPATPKPCDIGKTGSALDCVEPPLTWGGPHILSMRRTPSQRLRDQAEALTQQAANREVLDKAEWRWRAAIEACGK